MKMRGSWAQPLRVVGTVQKQARQVTIHYRHHSYYQHHHYSELEMDCCTKQPFNSEISEIAFSWTVRYFVLVPN